MNGVVFCVHGHIACHNPWICLALIDGLLLQMLHRISSGLVCSSRQERKKLKSLSGISSTSLRSLLSAGRENN